jgi:hypothetical protein
MIPPARELAARFTVFATPEAAAEFLDPLRRAPVVARTHPWPEHINARGKWNRSFRIDLIKSREEKLFCGRGGVCVSGIGTSGLTQGSPDRSLVA